MAPETVLVATRRLTGEEAALGHLVLHPDLDALELVGPDELPLAGGGVVVLDHAPDEPEGPDDICVLAGPTGWLGEAPAGGDLVALRWEGGALSVETLEAPADELGGRRVAAALVTTVAALGEREAGEEDAAAGAGAGPEVSFLTSVLEAMVADEPEALARPVPPMSEMLATAGLEYHEGWVGWPGTDWSAQEAGQKALVEMTMLAATHALTRSGMEALRLLLAALAADEAPPAAVLATSLAAEHGVAPAFVVGGLASSDHDTVEGLAEQARKVAHGRQRAPALWALAACAERRHDPARQEQLLGDTMAADPTYRPALADLSWYASDRGQAGRAASLLGSAGVPADDGWRRRLERFASPGPVRANRNDPCPCLSGRKHKSCCMATNGWPVDERLSWLYDKAVAFLHRPPQRPALDSVLQAWVAGAGGGREALTRLGDDPLPTDLALFEGGVMARFVEERGPLLPADEADVVASWVPVRRRLCEVIEVHPDEGLVLEDLITGESLAVRERAATHSLRPHLLVYLRALPDGAGGYQLFGGGNLLPFGHHEGLAELLRGGAGAEELAAWWGATTLAPRITTGDGQDIVLARAVLGFAPGGPAGDVASRLAGVVERDSDDFLSTGEARVVGNRIVLEAHSAERLEGLVAVVRGAVPEVEVLDSVALPLTAKSLRRGARDLSSPGPPDSPEVAQAVEAAIAERLRAYEEQWVDEPIPALGGVTPREAAADPVRRRDLERLLAEMAVAAGGMDADRVRSLVGL